MDYSLIVKLTNSCNLNCSYCYHRHDLSRNFKLSLTHNQIETVIRQLLNHNARYAEFIWHGGEPLLAGLDTFRFIVEQQEKYNNKNLRIRNSVQTNGTLLNKEYIDFFITHDFSIGISMDGPFDMHSAERNTTFSEYETILQSVDFLKKTDAKYGILCVVGKQHIGHARQVFQMIQEHQIGNIGFLPCIVHNNGEIDRHLTISPEDYAQFLIDLFDIWINSNTRGLSIRNFDDCIRFYRGKSAKTCISCNICDRYLTVTPDGGIYLCDNFSSSKDHLVGDIQTGFNSIEDAAAMKWLKKAMTYIPTVCKTCKYYSNCRGGCKYYRWLSDAGMNEKQYYCNAYQKLYDYIGMHFIKGE